MAVFKTKKGRIIKVDSDLAINKLRKLGLEELVEGKSEKEIRAELFAEIAKLDIKQPAKNAKTDDLRAILEANK